MNTFAVIAGGEAHRLFTSGLLTGEILPPHKTPFGVADSIMRIESGDTSFLFLARHGLKTYQTNSSSVSYMANMYALKDLGAKHVLAWSGVGSIAEGFPAGTFAVLEDVIDDTRSRASTYFTHSGVGFIRQSPLFCPVLRSILHDTMCSLGCDLRDGGIYACTEGPRLNTAAEIRKYQVMGAELIGTTICPEVFLARELELSYAAFAIVTNRAEGTVLREFNHTALFNGMVSPEEFESVQTAVNRIPEICQAVAKAVRVNTIDSPNFTLLEGYRTAGIIDSDWKRYICPGCDDNVCMPS